MLLKDHYDLAFAVDGRDAMVQFSAEKPDLVLLDLSMPNMAGMEALRAIKRLDQRAVVIILTAYASIETAQEALRLGAFDYLTKPFRPADIEAVIRRAIEHRIELLHAYLKTEAELQRSQFLTNISHELRTPLTPLMGAIELLQENVLGPLTDKQIVAVDMAARQVERMRRLVNDILDLFKFESGSLSLTMEAISLRTLAQDSMDAYAHAFREKALFVRNEIPEHLPPILADRHRFGQVLDNVLDNALKYTHTGGVTLCATLNDYTVQLIIADTGIGMTPDECRRVFVPFYQVDSTQKGTGLGLTIVKQLIEAHGGAIQIESNAPGSGCRLIITMPTAIHEQSQLKHLEQQAEFA
jgi:signal transduction histidine kinase